MRGIEFYEICKIISEKNPQMITKFFDIRYHINTKDNNDNKELESREEKIILVSSKDNISLLNYNNNIYEFL